MKRYPQVEVDLSKLRNNVEQIVSRAKAKNIEIAGVIKGFTGIPEASMQFQLGGCSIDRKSVCRERV